MDDWETVDVASTGVGLETAAIDPVSAAGFSIFMSTEAGTPAGAEKDDTPENSSGSALAGSPAPDGKKGRRKSAEGRNIFIGMEPPKPSWVRENY